MGFCKCEGTVEYKFIKKFSHFPLKGKGSHIKFILLKCTQCGGMSGFPDKNFEVALEEGCEDSLGEMRELFLQHN